MTTFITRCGKQLAADEVFEAWTSGDLDRMVQALLLPTHPVDRHFLLMGIVEQSYKLQGLDEMRELCLRVGRLHAAEYPGIAPALREDANGQLPPQVPSFVKLIALLEDEGELEEAARVCEMAIGFGLEDGTKGGYKRRLASIARTLSERQSGDA